MSNRRSFFKKLFGAALAPFLPVPKSNIVIPIKVVPIYAATRRLRANWSIELKQPLT